VTSVSHAPDSTGDRPIAACALEEVCIIWCNEVDCDCVGEKPPTRAEYEAQKHAGHRFNNALRYRDGEHPNQTQFTPRYVLDPVRVDLGGVIGLDPCTTEDNPVGADTFWTPALDGLEMTWGGCGWEPTIFVNPPYSKAREPWVERCLEAGERGQKVILLIPAATDTRIFQKAAATADALVFVKGRVKFGTLRPNRRQHAASHPSALIGWNTDLAACSQLGWRAAA
jgi:phage N-6-adenine-methyltransferase